MATAKDLLKFCSSDAKQRSDNSEDDDYQPLVDKYSKDRAGSDGSDQDSDQDIGRRRSSGGRGSGCDDGIVWHHDDDEEDEVEEESLLSGVQSLFGVPATPGGGAISMEQSRFGVDSDQSAGEEEDVTPG